MDLYTFLLSLFWGEILLYLLFDNFFLPSPEALRHLDGLVRELAQNTFEFAFNGLCSAVHRIALGLVNFSFDVCHRIFFGVLGCYKAWLRAMPPPPPAPTRHLRRRRLRARGSAKKRKDVEAATAAVAAVATISSFRSTLTSCVKELKQLRSEVEGLAGKVSRLRAVAPSRVGDGSNVADARTAGTRIAARGRQSISSNYTARPTRLIREMRERQVRALVDSVTARYATPEQEAESPAQDDDNLGTAESPAVAQQLQEQSGQTKEEEVVTEPTVVVSQPHVWRQPIEDSPSDDDDEEEEQVVVSSPVVSATLSACERGEEPSLLAQLSEAFQALEVTPPTGDTAGSELAVPASPELWLPSTPSFPSLPSLPPVPSLPSLSGAAADELPQQEQLLDEEPKEYTLPYGTDIELWLQLGQEFGEVETSAELDAQSAAPLLPTTIETSIPGHGEALVDVATAGQAEEDDPYAALNKEFEEAAPAPMELDAPSPPPLSPPGTTGASLPGLGETLPDAAAAGEAEDDFDPYALDYDAYAQLEKELEEAFAAAEQQTLSPSPFPPLTIGASPSGLVEALVDVAMGEAYDPYASDNHPYANLDEELEDASALVELVAPLAASLLPRTIETSIPGLGEALPENDAAARPRPGTPAAAPAPSAAAAAPPAAASSAFNAAAFRGRNFNFQPAPQRAAVGPAAAPAPAGAGVVAPATAAAAPNNNSFAPPASSFWDNTSQTFGGSNAVVEGPAASTAPPPLGDDALPSVAPFSPLQTMRDDAFGDAEAEALLAPLILEMERLRRLEESG